MDKPIARFRWPKYYSIIVLFFSSVCTLEARKLNYYKILKKIGHERSQEWRSLPHQAWESIPVNTIMLNHSTSIEYHQPIPTYHAEKLPLAFEIHQTPLKSLGAIVPAIKENGVLELHEFFCVEKKIVEIGQYIKLLSPPKELSLVPKMPKTPKTIEYLYENIGQAQCVAYTENPSPRTCFTVTSMYKAFDHTEILLAQDTTMPNQEASFHFSPTRIQTQLFPLPQEKEKFFLNLHDLGIVPLGTIKGLDKGSALTQNIKNMSAIINAAIKVLVAGKHHSIVKIENNILPIDAGSIIYTATSEADLSLFKKETSKKLIPPRDLL